MTTRTPSDTILRLAWAAALRSKPTAWLATLAVALLLPLALAAPAAAQTVTLDLSTYSRADPRALAMGNAFGPVARGENALLYNPAGLGQLGLDFKIEATLLAEGETGGFLKDTFDQLSGTGSLPQYLTDYLGQSNSYRAQASANAVVGIPGIGGVGAGKWLQQRYVFTLADVGGTPGSPDPTDTFTVDKDDLTLSAVSMGFSLKDGQLLLGATLKSFQFSPQTASTTFGAMTSIELATSGPKYEGSGYDLGMIWRMESLSFFRPQWSLVAFNVGGITLNSTQSPIVLEVPATYNAGIQFNPSLPLPFLHLLMAFEYEDITNATKFAVGPVNKGRNTTQRLHYGLEFGVWETTTGNHVLNFRYGRNRGQRTYGGELNLWSVLRVVYTRYGEDYGVDGATDIHEFGVVQLTMGFGF